MTKPLLHFFLPPSTRHLTMSLSLDPSSQESFLSLLLSNGQAIEVEAENSVPRPTSLRMLLTTPSRSVHHYWRMFDDAFMRPVFGGRGFVPLVPGSPTERDGPDWVQCPWMAISQKNRGETRKVYSASVNSRIHYIADLHHERYILFVRLVLADSLWATAVADSLIPFVTYLY